MLFQSLDDKSECVGIYQNGELLFGDDVDLSSGLSKTWNYSNFLENHPDIEYAQVYCNGESLDKICPSHLIEEWELISGKLKAFLRANKIAKVDLAQNCFFDVTPHKFLIRFCELKNEICEWVFDNYPRPENYEHMAEVRKVLCDIKYRPINLDMTALQRYYHERKAKDLYMKFSNNTAYCDYNQYGAITGRLGMNKGSFPILNLKKEYRQMVKPNNDFFVELDYNAAEARVVLALLGVEQPEEDIHDFHAKTLYRGLLTREEAKKRFFAWLYNPSSEDYLSNRQYDREEILSKYYFNGHVQTLFDRKINCDDFHAFNYLIQSTCADVVLDRMCDIYKLLLQRKSYIAFTLHDSIIIDFSSEDKDMLKMIIETYKNTKLGNFKTSISAGKDMYNLKLINI